jgi:hypothetical protein
MPCVNSASKGSLRLLRQMPGDVHGPGKEARIEQVQDRVLDAADILVHVHPVRGVMSISVGVSRAAR